MIYDQTQKNIGSIFPENTLTLLDPLLIEETLILALPGVLKAFPEIQAVDMDISWDENPSSITASYGLLEALLSHDIASIYIFRLKFSKENDATSLPDNSFLQKLHIQACYGEEALIATLFTSFLSKLKALKQLSIPEKIAANIDSSAFTSLIGLEQLTLNANVLKVKFQDFAQLPYLTRLNVSIGTNKDNIRRLAEELKKRTTPLYLGLVMGLDSINFGKQHFQTLFENQQYSQITGLSLNSGNRIAPQSLRYMDSAFADNMLHTLLLQTRALKNGGVDTIAKSPYFSSLTCLSLKDPKLDNQDVQTLISSIATHTALKVLRMDANITDVQPLLNGGNTTLTVLSLDGALFNSSNVQKIKFPRLTEFSFSYSAQPGEKLTETCDSFREQLTSLGRVYINGAERKSEETLVDILNKGDVTKGRSTHPFDKYF